MSITATDPDTILLEAEEAMTKAVDYLSEEMKGVRSGRATTALVDFVKVEVYGSMSDLKQIAAISVPEPTQILIKPYDASTCNAIKQAIENSGLGLNPTVEAKQVRLSVPPLSGDRRKQLIAHVKKVGEQQKVVVRNTRRDANKAADGLSKSSDVQYSEDEIKSLKDEIQDLVKKYEGKIESMLDAKVAEISDI